MRGGGLDVGGVGLGGEVAPVGGGGVVDGEAALVGEEVALEVVFEGGQHAGAVVDAIGLAAVVGGGGGDAEALAVDGPGLQLLGVSGVFNKGVGRALEGVEGPAADMVAAVPGTQGVAQRVGKGPAFASVGTAGVELEAAGGELVGLGDEVVGVPDGQGVALDVELDVGLELSQETTRRARRDIGATPRPR